MKKNFAFYVKDKRDYLLLSMIRDKGGFYINMPRKDLDTHVSYHTDGNYWIKGFGKKKMAKKKQALDENFKGFENVLQTSFKPSYGEGFNRSFNPASFDEHIFISENEISNNGLNISIDLIEPNTIYNYYEDYSDYFNVIKKEVFKNIHPWLCITLFESIITTL